MSTFGQHQNNTSSFGFLNSSAQNQQNKPAFGSSFASQPQQQGGPFSGLGQSQQQQNTVNSGTGMFGASTLQSQQQQQQQPFGSSLFGASQQQQAQQSLQQSQGGSGSIWQPGMMNPRQKTIPEQIQLIYEKWSPESPNCSFQHYFYNKVNPDQAAFYRPGQGEDERQWEEALAKKPAENMIPALCKGFASLGMRLEIQAKHVQACNMKLHELNDWLTQKLQTHDLVTSVRAADARRKHQTLSQRCLALATKVQVLRNRGYAMDVSEEDLKQNLVALERNMFDPALAGRSEEIWARMVAVREKIKVIQEETEKAGRIVANGEGEGLDEEVMEKARKVLDDYDQHLMHLKNELARIQKDLEAWEEAKKPVSNGWAR